MKNFFLTIITLAIMLGCEEATIVDSTPIATWDEVFGSPNTYLYAGNRHPSDESHQPLIEYDKSNNLVGTKRGFHNEEDIASVHFADIEAINKYKDFVDVDVGADMPAGTTKEDYITSYPPTETSPIKFGITLEGYQGSLFIGDEVAKIKVYADKAHTDLVTVYSFRL